MQSAGAIREIVLKLLDVLVYVGVYFIGAPSSLWPPLICGLLLPFVVWLALATCHHAAYFVAKIVGRIEKISLIAARLLTGRIVDSYTNIMTVKLFAHAGKEERYSRSKPWRSCSKITIKYCAI